MSLRLIVELLQLSLKIIRQLNALRTRRRPTAAPPAAPAAAAPRRRSPIFRTTVAALLGGASAAGAAYWVVQRQRRIRARRRPVRAPFANELLAVLAAPGGGALFYSGDGLLETEAGEFYGVVDGIPDFGGEPSRGSARAVNPYALLLERLLRRLTEGRMSADAMALAGSVAWAAGEGWCLSLSRGADAGEIEMARANPRARIVCLRTDWDELLEVRWRALEAGLPNLYCLRGPAELLPARSGVFHSAWTANLFHACASPHQAMLELMRVLRPGAQVAGLALAPGGSRLSDGLLRLRAGRLPGLRDAVMHLATLTAVGLREVRAFREGACLRFAGVRA